jgi:hypothetical protein
MIRKKLAWNEFSSIIRTIELPQATPFTFVQRNPFFVTQFILNPCPTQTQCSIIIMTIPIVRKFCICMHSYDSA